LKSGRKKSFTAETAHKIASYLGVSVAYLLGEEEKNEEQKEKPTVNDDGLSEAKQKLIEKIKTLPEDQVLLLLQVAERIV
jgi:transcriptional regulator with XRE-family HTH domain